MSTTSGLDGGVRACGAVRPLPWLWICVWLWALVLHLALEWLFFATKPSFLWGLDWSSRWWVLAAGSAPVVLAGGAVGAVVALAATRRSWPLGRVLPLLASATLAATAVLLLDNFTRTLFATGLFRLGDAARWAYLGCWLAIALSVAGPTRRIVASVAGSLRARRALGWATAGLLALLGLTAGLAAGRARPESTGTVTRPVALGSRPNVILVGSDGVNAARTSLYGSPRETTPFLARLGKDSLVVETAYPNASSTAASTTSILTGQLPLATGVVYPPDIARGSAVYRHLPGILRHLGYGAQQATVRWYADSADLNLQRAFEWANGRALESPADGWVRVLVTDPDARYFLQLVRGRLVRRFGPRAGDPTQVDVFREVVAAPAPARDEVRLASLFGLIDAGSQPFFAHLHLMGTHGPRFEPRARVFSQGRAQTEDWSPDAYDDALLDFDGALREIVDALRRRGLWDRTILVVYSDHGQKYATDVPVPLLFHFPNGAFAGRWRGLAQNLDIAPTLLDALGLPLPREMGGQSLLSPMAERCRPVVAAVHSARLDHVDGWWYATPQPPFYTLGGVRLVDGRFQHHLALGDGAGQWRAKLAQPAPDCPGLERAAARQLLLAELATTGYDVTGLRK